MRTLSLFFLSLLAGLLSSCITEDEANNTPTGNFETCWKLIDEHYCFFDYKNKEYGLDWAAVRERYRQGVTDNMRSEQLFEVLRRMTAELRDGHVNLYAAHDVARYGAWFDDFPMNFSDSLARRYLGRSEDFRVGSGLRYRVLSDNVGYIRCASFASPLGSGNLQEMMRALAMCDGLIVDVRSNWPRSSSTNPPRAPICSTSAARATTISLPWRPSALSRLRACAGKSPFASSQIAAPLVPPTVS